MLLSRGSQVSPMALALQVRTETKEDSREEEIRRVGETDKWPQAKDEPLLFLFQMLQLRSQEPQAPH